MNANFGFSYNILSNIEKLANCRNINDITIKNDKEISTEHIPQIQDRQQIAIILKNTLNDFLSIKNLEKNEYFYNKNPEELEHVTTLFQQALKNYQFLGFEEMAPLELSTNTNLFKNESAASEDLKQVKMALEKANDRSLPVSERLTYMPQMTGAMTANGTYYVCGDKNSERLFIAKPALQEAGAPKNPQKHPQTRDGIEGGEGAFRERIVYAGQNLLNFDCGIPPTFVVQEKNNFLSSEVDFDKIMTSLDFIKKFDPDMTLQKFINFIKEGLSPTEIVNLLKSPQTSNLSNIESKAYEIINEKGSVSYALLVKELRANGYPMAEIQSQAVTLKQILEKSAAEDNLSESVETLINQVLLSSDQLAIMSMQKYVPDCQSLSWWLARFDENTLPVEEVHKLIIDLIFFNTDRHLGNVLVDMNATTPKFILIDHGSCLPRPLGEDEGKGLKQARYEFLELSHCNQVLHPKFAETIKNLDINQYIESLKKEQRYHQEKFGNVCHVPDDCFHLIRLNLHLVQVGIEIGATLREIGSVHQILSSEQNSSPGGEIVDIYLKHVHDKNQVDWSEVRDTLKNVLISKK